MSQDQFFYENVVLYDANGQPHLDMFALDSLASYSVIRSDLANALGLQPTGSNVATGVNGYPTQFDVTLVGVSIRNRSPERLIMMIADAPLNVLGIDVIRKYGLMAQTNDA